MGKLNYAAYLRLPDDGKRYELVDGELVPTPSPTTRHQRIVLRLAKWLDDFVQPGGLGEVFTAPLDVVLSEHTVVQPDVVFVSREHKSRVKEDGIFGPPDLVIEVASPSTRERDLGVKKVLYRRAGVVEYWIVDPDAPSLTVVRGTNERSFTSGTVRPEVSALRGLELNLDRLFAQ